MTSPRPAPGRRRGPRLLATVLGLALVPAVVITLARALGPATGIDARLPFAQAVSATPWAGLGAAVLLVVAGVALLAGRRTGTDGSGRAGTDGSGRAGSPRALVAVTVVAALVTVTHAMWLAPLATADGPSHPQGAPVRVMTVNARLGLADPAAIVAIVREQHVTLLAVEELTATLVTGLHAAGIDDTLPHRTLARTGPGDGYRGSGLWSAEPLGAVGADPALEGRWFGMPRATVDLGGTPVTVTVVHTVAPVPGQTGAWARDLRAVAAAVGHTQGDQVVLGDLNATRDHSLVRAILAPVGARGVPLVDAPDAAGAGLHLTWPADRWYPAWTAIDHVLAPRTWRVQDVRTAAVPGSDHRALLATLTPP